VRDLSQNTLSIIKHCLLAARQRPAFLHGQHTTTLNAARREQSRKPEEFYALVELPVLESGRTILPPAP